MSTFPVTKSTLSADALQSFVVEHYNLSNSTNCKLFRTGMNHTYFITDTATKYVLRVYCYKWRTKAGIQEELQLLNTLKTNKISVSFPVKNSKNEFINTIQAPEGERYAVLFSFAEGEKVRFMDTDNCFTVGKLMATIHNTTLDKAINRTQYNIDTLVDKPYNSINGFFPETLESMEYLKNTGKQLTEAFNAIDLKHFKQGIIHADLWYDNMNITEDNAITIFDFDFCGNGLQIIDVAYFCKQLFHIEADKNNYELKFKSFIEGYQSVKLLSKEELAFIPNAGAAIWIFYLGVQARRFDWSNIFLTKNYLNLFFVARIKSWLEYYESKDTVFAKTKA
jgi:Ser/Thr protein kinase RdoA (MazF antagonist)